MGGSKRTGGRTTPRKVKPSRTVRPPKGNEQHPQVGITYGDLTAEVDEGIADLILACWKAGFPTLRSCQGTRNSDWFPHVAFDRAHIAPFVEAFAGVHGERGWRRELSVSKAKGPLWHCRARSRPCRPWGPSAPQPRKPARHCPWPGHQ